MRKSEGALATVASGEASVRATLRAALILLAGLNLCIHAVLWPSSSVQERTMINDAAAIIPRPPAVGNEFRPTKELASLPVYTREMAYLAVRPVAWTCGDREEIAWDPLSDQKPMFAFVHVYKAAGSTVRLFFKKYAAICRKTWMVLIGCTGVKASSIQSDENWKRCRVKEVADGRRHLYDHESADQRVYPTVNRTILRDNVDLVGGHIRTGTGDSIFDVVQGDSAVPPVRHIVFLRDPMSRFVSGILYQINQKEGVAAMEDVAKLIKKRIRGSRRANEYWGSSLMYLLTPKQAETFSKVNPEQIGTTPLMPEEYAAESKALVAIRNLVHYNAIIGMAERMTQSMEILRHALYPDQLTSEQRKEYLNKLFEEYIPDDAEAEEDAKNSNNGFRMNASEREGVSTASVLEELKKDSEFMSMFEEYVKYEQMITDFAWKMHLMQHEMTMGKLFD